ncbi:MAG: hypothetical protein OXI16_13800 [Chloroflexota bacterium]|nr:hypothetical protein [Chloroflexota bacterium]
MAIENGAEAHIDLAVFREVQQMRRRDAISDDDRIVFFAPDEPVCLYTAFGHGADDAMFKAIARANFRALSRGLGCSDGYV